MAKRKGELTLPAQPRNTLNFARCALPLLFGAGNDLAADDTVLGDGNIGDIFVGQSAAKADVVAVTDAARVVFQKAFIKTDRDVFGAGAQQLCKRFLDVALVVFKVVVDKPDLHRCAAKRDFVKPLRDVRGGEIDRLDFAAAQRACSDLFRDAGCDCRGGYAHHLKGQALDLVAARGCGCRDKDLPVIHHHHITRNKLFKGDAVDLRAA